MQKVLIIRFSSIGDIVLTTPIIRAIKAQKPSVEIHFITKATYAAVLENHPNIDRLILLKNSLKDVIHEIRNENYDLIIDLHKNWRSLRIKTALRRPSISFQKLNLQKWWMVRFKKNGLPAVHIVDRYLKELSKYGVVNDQQGLDYYSGLENEKSIPFLNHETDSYAALVLGGTYFTKKIPEVKLHEIIQHLRIPILLLGGKEESSLAEILEIEYPQKVFSLVGKSSLNESAEIIRRSRFVITGDTGLMHIAAAYQKKIYSLWGNTIPEFGMYPYLPSTSPSAVIIEVKGLNCRPCSKLGFHHCPKKHFDCMMKQNISIIQQE